MYEKEIITFCSNDIEKRKFHYSKYEININNVDVAKITKSNKVCFGKNVFKYFIRQKGD